MGELFLLATLLGDFRSWHKADMCGHAHDIRFLG
jgi:hypothetical protein